MKNIDFLFLYEHRNRELENCAYLANVLKERGYSVKIESILSFAKKIYRPKIIIVPHLYDDNQVRYYTSSVWRRRKVKIIDMQYEQVLSAAVRKMQIHRPKDSAKKAFHVAWGTNEYNEYINNGIESSNILCVGSINLDFNTKHFQKYLIGREEIARLCGLPEEKKWCIFFSSFAYCGKEDAVLKNLSNYDVALRLKEITQRSKPEILEWFRNALNNNHELILIYRRHPAEIIGDDLIQFTKEYRNRFFLIEAYSVRHWINASDYCYTWFSTTSIDAYFANKPCHILRPYPLDFDLELEVLYGITNLETAEAFYHSLDNNYFSDNKMYEKNISKFFYNKVDEIVIGNYIDSFEYVLNDKCNDNIFESPNDNLRTRLVEDFLGILCDLAKCIHISRLISFFSKTLGSVVSYYEKEVFGQNEEIALLENKIGKFLKGNCTCVSRGKNEKNCN